jgi:hypothetical protein
MRTPALRRLHNPSRLNPMSALGYTELLIRTRIDRARARRRDDARDVGASVVEWVIITALLVGLAIAVGAILVPLITNKAKTIQLDTNTGT